MLENDILRKKAMKTKHTEVDIVFWCIKLNSCDIYIF